MAPEASHDRPRTDTEEASRRPGLVASLLRGPWVLPAILLLALLVRLPGLADLGYGVDEGNTAAEAIRLVDEYGWKYWDIPTKSLSPLSSSMPLSYYLAAIGLETAGRDFVGLRLPFLGLGLLSVILTWILALRTTSSRSVAALAALYLALSTSHINYSMTARFYLPSLVVALLAVLALQSFLRRPAPVTALGLAVVSALGFLTHHLFVLFGPIALILIVVSLRRPPDGVARGYRKRLVCLALLAFALASPPLLITIAKVATAGQAQASAEASRSTYAVLRNIARAGGGALLRVEVPVLLLSLLGGYIALRRCGRGGLVLALMAFGFAAEIFAMGFFGQIRGRYILWCLPYFVILAALATRWTPTGERRAGSAALIAALVVVALGTNVAAYHGHGDGRVAARQVRLEAHRLAGDARIVILGVGPPPEARALAGWDMDRLSLISTRSLHDLPGPLEPLMGERLLLVVHQQTEPLVLKSGLLDDRRIRRVGTLIDRSRRQSLYYSFFEWTPD